MFACFLAHVNEVLAPPRRTISYIDLWNSHSNWVQAGAASVNIQDIFATRKYSPIFDY